MICVTSCPFIGFIAAYAARSFRRAASFMLAQ